MRTPRPGLVALLSGGIAAGLAWWHLTRLEGRLVAGGALAPVLVARGYIREGTILRDELVEASQVPQAYRQPGALSSSRELSGDRGGALYATRAPFRPGEQILGTKLVLLGGESGLALLVPAGHRAVTVALPRPSGLAGFLQPGNSVDVVATFEKGERAEPLAVTILRQVLVLAVGRSALGANPSLEASTAGGTGAAAEPSRLVPAPGEEETVSVTMAVTPRQAQALALAVDRGRLHLALVPAGEAPVPDGSSGGERGPTGLGALGSP